jgi:hypothetical protein
MSAPWTFFEIRCTKTRIRPRRQKNLHGGSWFLFHCPCCIDILSNVIWDILKSKLHFNGEKRLYTGFERTNDFLKKGIDDGAYNFYQTSSYRVTRYGTYSWLCLQYNWSLSFTFDACHYFHFWWFVEGIRFCDKQPSHALFTYFLSVQRPFPLILSIVRCLW